MNDKQKNLRVHARAQEVVRRLVGEDGGPSGPGRRPSLPPPNPDELELPPGGGPDAAEERTEIDIGHDLLAVADGGAGDGGLGPEAGDGPDPMERVRELARELLALHGETDEPLPDDPSGSDLPPDEAALEEPPGRPSFPPRGR